MKGVKEFNPDAAKKRFFEIYLDKVIMIKRNVTKINSSFRLLCDSCFSFVFLYSTRSQSLELDFLEHLSLLLR